MERIAKRRKVLEQRTTSPEEFLVPGTYAALRLLQERGLELYLASGTDENYVREEVELLSLTPFFGRHVYGAVADHRQFSKQMVIERLLRENRVEGSRLIGLGDGYVEIDNIKGAGGTAIAGAAGTDIGNVGRNILRGPRQANVDFAFSRVLPLAETKTVELRAEFFNLFNWVNFANPLSDFNGITSSGGSIDSLGRVIAPGDFGRIISTSNNPRIIQLALKLVF